MAVKYYMEVVKEERSYLGLVLVTGSMAFGGVLVGILGLILCNAIIPIIGHCLGGIWARNPQLTWKRGEEMISIQPSSVNDHEAI